MKAIKNTSSILLIITIISLILLAPWVYGISLELIGFLLPTVPDTTSYQYLHMAYIVLFFTFLDAGELIFYTYLVSALIFPFLTLAVFWMMKKRMIFKYFSTYYIIVGLLVYSSFLKNFITTTGTYFLSIKIKKDTQYSVIDFPQNILSSSYKRMHITAEGRSVNYEILGWQNDSVLVYRQWNRLVGSKKQMRYDLQTKRISSSDISLNILSKNTCDAKNCLTEFLDEDPNSLTGCLVAYISPDSQRFACLAAHLYGPQDIIVFEKN